MSNETKQHTPTPWFQSHREGKDGGHRTEIYDTTGETVATLTWYAMPKNKDGVIGTYREANAKRIITCVNALEGIEDPEFYIKNAEKLMRIAVECVPYKTACESINKDNPMAVAENLARIYELLKYLSITPLPKTISESINELLTKIQSK